jgi:hypothetical protein
MFFWFGPWRFKTKSGATIWVGGAFLSLGGTLLLNRLLSPSKGTPQQIDEGETRKKLD